ncbi:hypothetical protein Lal_00026145 [Lupinus albus]|uniref:Reticulon-like protein n=1 Tax=Lupinus albus TaxID=3870 RepID=A0A6A5MGW7_LUPAL|nr:hypothetical protein Lalb_Chr08g0234111 [Lupinus albus]KAF1870660.1 hypothetical protein Lal_00026145 [Lupinus albus]
MLERRMKSHEEEEGIGRLKRNPIVGVTASGGKRKTWNSEDGIKKSQIQRKKIGFSADKSVRRSIIHTTKLRSEKQGGEGKLLKTNSDSFNKNDSDSAHSLRKSKSDSGSSSGYVLNESRNVNDVLDSSKCEMVVVEDENKKNDCDEKNFNDFEVCREKVISNNLNNESVVNDEEEEVEIKLENETFDVKEINVPESNSNVVVKEQENKNIVVHEVEKKKVMIDESENKKKKKKKILNESEPKKIVSANMRFHHTNEKPLSVPMVLNQNFNKANSIPKEEYDTFPQTQNKLQSLVDLIMWKDVSRSAFIFGFGTFVIVSSSYAKDVNLSIVSVMSYIGLIYLAVIFLYRSLVCRGVIDVEDSNYVLGEEEAIWVLKLFLPYFNELLSKFKPLFSGDPGTTIKLAVLLFVMARCGSCITVWKMAKIGFFGVFTVPKICSSYSAQLTAYANFWILRFRDAWDSCSHKKAVALGIFGLVWNLSSVIARIWAVFVLFVAFKYYQQHYLMREECIEDEAECDETLHELVEVGLKKGNVASCFIDTNKVKKRF